MSDTAVGVGSHARMAKGQATNFIHNMPISVEDTQVERIEGFIRPTGGVAGGGPYEIIIPPVHDAYLMLGTIALYVKARVVNADGTAIGNRNAAIVAPINALGITMWEHIETHLNDYPINSGSATNAHYKAYIETLLSYDETSKESHLRAQMYAQDTVGEFGEMAIDGANAGFDTRSKYVAQSQIFDMMGPIAVDFLRADKHLAPGNKLSFRFHKARDAFLLNCPLNDPGYKLELLDIRLYYQRVRLRESIPSPTMERYLYNKTELKRFPVPAGMTSYFLNFHTAGKMPKSIIIGQVSTAAAEGQYGENPLHFQHFNLNLLGLKINGQRVPAEPLRPDFTGNGLVAREYLGMFMNTGLYRVDRGNCISYGLFKRGLTLFPFDLNPDVCNGSHLHLAKEGNITIEFGWAEALTDPITILIHASYDEIITKRKNDSQRFTIEEV